MMTTDLVRDVMHRTMFNLRFIEERAAPDGPYEVTQLVNSFLCAYVLPWERLPDKSLGMSLEEAAKRGWPIIKKELPEDQDPENLGRLIRLVRNSFAHGNIELLSGPDGNIQGIRFWNNRRGRGRTWGARLSVWELREYLERFAARADELHRAVTEHGQTRT